MKRIIFFVPLVFLLCLNGQLAAQTTLTQVEYFYDTDPGVGRGSLSTISSPADSVRLSLHLPVGSLTSGFHMLYMRFKNDSGTWGQEQSQEFLVNSTFDSASPQINAGEYFFDIDPGLGHGAAIPGISSSDSVNVSFTPSVSGLSAGFHQLFARFRYTNGVWGNEDGRDFYVIPTGASPQITAGEYFFDTDPGVGHGTAIPGITSSDSVSVAFAPSVSSLGAGFHYLFVRFKYTNGVWGDEDGRDFYVVPIVASPQISAAEYFFDTDPGVGNGTAVPGFTAADSVSFPFSPSVNGLSTGFHHLYVRFKYANGVWGLYDGRDFYVVPTGATGISPEINYAEYFVDSDPGIGNGTHVTVSPSTDSTNLLVGVSSTGLLHGNHLLYFRFRYTNGVWGLYQPQHDTFTVCTPPVDTIRASGLISYCVGGSVTLKSDTSHTWTYQWQRNGVNLVGDTNSTLVITDSGGIYDVVVTDTGNCPGTSDSITVNVYMPTSYVYSQSICSGQSINFYGHTLTATGTYRDTLQNVHGCDSIVTLNLTVSSTITVNLSASICPGGSYPFNSQNLTQQGTYHDTVTVAGGCDSITTLTLSFYPVYTTPVSGSFCYGSNYPFHGQNLDTSGVYKDTLTTIHGCDSVVVLTLTEYYAVFDTISPSICQGSSYSFNNQNLTSAGTYQGTFTTQHGCDSNVTVHLQVLLPVTDSTSAAICAGSTYPFNGHNLDSAGVYNDTLTGVNTCDSIVILTLTVDSLPVVVWIGNPDTLCTNSGPVNLVGATPVGGNYAGAGVWAGTFYPDSAGQGVHVVSYTYRDSSNCSDSVTKTFIVQICGGITTPSGNTMTLFPNPANDVVIIQSGNLFDNQTQAVVRDVTGKMVGVGYDIEADKIVMHIDGLASGVYMVTISLNGEEVSVRFVKQLY